MFSNTISLRHTATSSRRSSSPGKARQTIWRSGITIGLSLIAIALHLSSTLSTALQYSSAHGGWWQLLSCHLTHWNLDQLFWDVAAFFALGVVCERLNRRAFVLTLVIAALVIPLVTTWFHPQIDTYRGLSGVDSALFTLLACQLAAWGLKSKDRMLVWAGSLAWLVLLGKTGFEALTQATLFVSNSSDFVSLPIAHVAGALAGTTAWIFVTWSQGSGRERKGRAVA